ncbi:MAG: dockerin type I repeat-containing protein [Clostridia bacterium]|nr:dockerin type I repeat-containing protein [Clostridia bacterium]
MKSTKKRFLTAIISLVLSLALVTGSVVSVSAATELTDIFAGLLGGGSDSNMNLSQMFADWINGIIQESEEPGPIDKLIENIKNEWTGATEDTEGDPEADVEEVITIDKAEADNIAELFNLTVNELKNGAPAFNKTVVASMDAQIAQQLQGGLGPVTGIVESLIGTKDLFAGIIDGSNNENQITTKYKYGNDVINNLPIAGKEYVAALTGDDIKDYTITIYKSGAYRMHIDLKDVEGSAADSGLARVFDVTDKAYATINLGTFSLNVNVMLKYVNNYVECQVNRDGEIVSYTTGMGITFLFQQEDGTYGPEMPYLGVNFQKEGIIYNVITEYSGIDYTVRPMGDVDNNGKINSSDARTVLRVSAKLDEISETDAMFSDINGDGKITSSDAREILRASASLVKLPSTAEILGYDEYKKDEKVQKQIDDLIIILMAYQAAKDEETQKELQDYYDKLYGNGGETTTAPAETTTQGELNTPGNKVDDIIGGIGDIIGGDSSIGDIIGGDSSGGLEDILGGIIGGGDSSGSIGDIIGGILGNI